jgi:predicted ATP-grasp superfamily ATP-dependent carboligase
VRAHHPIVVLDLFNDLDVRELAQASAQVAGRHARFHAAKLLSAAERLCPPHDCAGLVYGSGFEGRGRLLERLARGRQLFGNAPATVARVKDPDRFFPLLDRIGLSHPPVRREPPADARGWLVKRIGGAGGSHVRHATLRHRARPDRYFQALQAGRVLSVLFAADGERAGVIGYNEQWAAPPWRRSRHRYGGAVGAIDLPAEVTGPLESALDRLVCETGLVGINGLDFILDGKVPQVLEINPRPPATLELHDPDVEGGLIALHLRACRGRLGPIDRARGVRAHAIVYAWQALRIPARFAWPEWCTDIPAAGSVIPGGAPICSVHACAETSQQARNLVEARAGRMTECFQERAA